jgi:hypothetical protein
MVSLLRKKVWVDFLIELNDRRRYRGPQEKKLDLLVNTLLANPDFVCA